MLTAVKHQDSVSSLPFDNHLLDRLMDEARIDVALTTSKHNVQYLLGGHRTFFFDHMEAMGPSRYLSGAGLSHGHRIFVLNEDGRCERVLGERDRPRFGEPFNHPADAVEAPDGEIFVADGLRELLRPPFCRGWNLARDMGAARTRSARVQHASRYRHRPGRPAAGRRPRKQPRADPRPQGGWLGETGCTSPWRSSRPRTAGFS